MAINSQFDGQNFAKAAYEGIISRVKSNLKQDLMRRAEEIVDEIVRNSVAEMEIDVQAYRDAYMNRDLVHFILHDKRTKNE